jgi:glutaredoxin
MKITRCHVLALLAFSGGAAFAQYKVVGPDGSVTYTDRPPVDTKARVTPINARGGATPVVGVQNLPLELRQAATRYPVTLYTAAGCAPCEPARAMLRLRGVPFSEKIISTEPEVAELTRIVGASGLPAVTVGGQAVSGLASETWNSYLDAAGYPRESKLPASFQYPAPTPLIERTEPAPAPRRVAEPTSAPEAPPPSSGFKF